MITYSKGGINWIPSYLPGPSAVSHKDKKYK